MDPLVDIGSRMMDNESKVDRFWVGTGGLKLKCKVGSGVVWK